MFEEIKKIVENAISEFNAKESYLIRANLSERCICAKFANYLERELDKTIYKDYNVDVEYNRDSHDNLYAKKVIGDVKNATVDLIVHKRHSNDNLICIEMKKSSKPRFLINDKKRLAIMTREYFNYIIGFMLVAENEKLSINEVFYNKSNYSF